ncbi:MAG: alkaline phosphatase family protein [Clostridiales bacterium]|nr:alkaline phosphatase family protein [Clostridiales bacterium]
MSKQKVILISFDAMTREDINKTLKNYPNFRWVMESGARIETMRSVYPTITYPVHASILTGCTVGRHGVLCNEKFSPGKPSPNPWNWFSSSLKVPDIFQRAKEAGLTTASIFWPVTGGNENIDYLIAEYWSKQEGKIKYFTADGFVDSGTSPQMMEDVVYPNMHHLEQESGRARVGDFIAATSGEVIRRYQPDLLLLHVGFIDYARHSFGMFSQELTERLHWADEYLGEVIQATKDAGVFEDTNFIILSDHGQININRAFNLNSLLREEGFIKVDETGKMLSWDAIIQSEAHSCHLYLKDPADEDLKQRVYDLLCRIQEWPDTPISRIYTAEEAREEEGLYGDFSFVLEGDGRTSFGNNWTGPVFMTPDLTDYKLGKATHGYHPDRGPQPPFQAAGPAFKQGVHLGRRRLIDVAPTIGKILGFDMGDVDGKVIEEILK